MNKFDEIVRKAKYKRLSTLALQIEALLRQAGDLAEELDDDSVGYFFLSTLDAGSLSCFTVGTAGNLAQSLDESCRRDPKVWELLTHAAACLPDELTF